MYNPGLSTGIFLSNLWVPLKQPNIVIDSHSHFFKASITLSESSGAASPFLWGFATLPPLALSVSFTLSYIRVFSECSQKVVLHPPIHLVNFSLTFIYGFKHNLSPRKKFLSLYPLRILNFPIVKLMAILIN